MTPPITGSYIFVLNVDDGGRMWIGGNEVYNRWSDRSGDPPNGVWEDKLPPMTLTAGQAYPIEIDYYNDAVAAEMKMSWTRPDNATEIVPTQYLSTDSQGAGPPAITSALTASAAVGTAFTYQ